MADDDAAVVLLLRPPPLQPPPPPLLLLLLACCCWPAVAGLLLLAYCCWPAAAAGVLLLTCCCWPATDAPDSINNTHDSRWGVALHTRSSRREAIHAYIGPTGEMGILHHMLDLKWK